MPLTEMTTPPFGQLASRISSELHTGTTLRQLYATDASEYQEMPAGVVFPKSEDDLCEVIRFVNRNKLGLILRAAGTSLAGQCVGDGLVVDELKHFTQILFVDRATRRVRVQPGVVRNELNHAIAADGLFFGPETSTAKGAMISGMVGNNSCGSSSIVYGSTREPCRPRSDEERNCDCPRHRLPPPDLRRHDSQSTPSRPISLTSSYFQIVKFHRISDQNI